MARQGSWERKLWEDLDDLFDRDSGAIRVVESTGDITTDGKLPLIDKSALLQTELLSDLLAEQRRTNFLLEQIASISIEAEVFK